MFVKKSLERQMVPIIALLFIGVQIFSSASAADEDLRLLHYRPQLKPLRYDLSIATRSQADALFETGPKEEHRDILNVNQKVERAGEDLLDIVLTVDGINDKEQVSQAREFHLTPRGGSAYKREDILGNSGHTAINLLGVVKEAKGIPHFGSVYFHPDNLSGPPLDIYAVVAIIYPAFPLKLLKNGEGWKVRDQIAFGSADALPIRGLATLKADLAMTVKREMDYQLIDYVQRGKYKTAHIRFRGSFSMDGKMTTEGGGDYIAGDGTSSGELYFAPDEGLVIEVSMKNEASERKSQDGTIVHWFNAEKSIAITTARPTPEITWFTKQDVRFALADAAGR